MSSSSSSSSESGSPPPPTRKRKEVPNDEVDSSNSSDSDNEHSGGEEAVPPPEDEIVLSHAERRRQKKKELKAETEAKTPSKKRKLDDGSAANVTPGQGAKPKRQNSVWVGNLSFWTTQDALKGFFDGVGEITRIHMPMKRGNKGENMGFAYVDFATPDAKVAAITLSEGQLDGRNLLIKDGNDFIGRPVKAPEVAEDGDSKTTGTKAASTGLTKTAQKILRVQKQPPAPTLFLGNLGFDTTEDSIRQLFEAHRYFKPGDSGKGKDPNVKKEDEEKDAGNEKDVWIRKVRMGTFEDSGACKGFAFVDFTSIEHATNALINPRNHRLNGRDLVVEYASADAVRRGGGPRGPKPEFKDGRGKFHKGSSEHTPRRKPRPDAHTNEGDATKAEVKEDPSNTPRSRLNRGGHDRLHKGRAKPGAALAQAPRQSAAIVPAQGQKIVF